MNVLVHVDNAIRILEADLPPGVVQAIEADLTLTNPRWEQVQMYGRGRRPNFQSEFLRYYRRKNGVLILPRGYISVLRLRLRDVPHTVVDRTRSLPEVDFSFSSSLQPYQARAVKDIVSRRFGVLEAPPGAGKTVMALAAIASRRQRALVIVHTKELLYQWVRRSCEHLGMDETEVGMIGDGHKRWGERLTIALINTLYRVIDEGRTRVGHLVVDECHHVPARTFTEAVGVFDCTYMLGLSATPYRRDKLTSLIHFYMGDCVHRILPTELQALRKIMRARLVVRHTGCAYHFDADKYQCMISSLVADERRNGLIVSDVQDCVRTGSGIALVISDRVSHCETLFRAVRRRGIEARLLTGAVPVRERARIIKDLNGGRARVLIATAQLIGEGFDLKELSSIFLATPVKFTGRVKQYIGRILRVSEDKREAVVYDYLDHNGMLRNSFHSRMTAYHDLGVTLSVP